MTLKPSQIRKAVDASLSNGWKLRKLLKAESSGFFGYRAATYDVRTVYDRKALNSLVAEGFSLSMDAGLLALNILISAP